MPPACYNLGPFKITRQDLISDSGRDSMGFFEAARRVKELGQEWELPSKNEIKLIAGIMNELQVKVFGDHYYWTSEFWSKDNSLTFNMRKAWVPWEEKGATKGWADFDVDDRPRCHVRAILKS